MLGWVLRSRASNLDHILLGQFAWLTAAHTLSIAAVALPIVGLVSSLLYFFIRVAKSRPATGFADKTLWEWMELLIVPIVLTLGGLYFGGVQAGNQADVEEQRAEDAALEAYFNEMGGLVLDQELSECGVDEDVRALARAQTSTVLNRVEGDRKGNVIEFLNGASLINRNCPIVSLAGTDLIDVQLSGADLSSVDLHEAKLASANLQDAQLDNAVLAGAWLAHTQGEDRPLGAANLRGANLSGADLRNANLSDTDLGWPLSPSGKNADLSGADLRGAILDSADLRGANLEGVDLRGASMNGTELDNAKGITREELQQQVSTLEGASMPNGSVYD